MARISRDDDRTRSGAARDRERPARTDAAEGRRAAPAPRRARTRATAGDTRSAPPEHADDGARRRIPAPAAARAGLRQIVELTGKEPEGVTAVKPADGGWIVGVEVVEDRRIPSASDILALYEAELDGSGDLTSYRRVRRYARGRGGDDGA